MEIEPQFEPTKKNESTVIQDPIRGTNKQQTIVAINKKNEEVKAPPLPLVSDFNLARIQNLYASKQQKIASKPEQKSSVQAISIANDNIPSQLHKFREEYDPARPNDFEVVMEERKKKKLEEEAKGVTTNEKEKKLKSDHPKTQEVPVKTQEVPVKTQEIPVKSQEINITSG